MYSSKRSHSLLRFVLGFLIIAGAFKVNAQDDTKKFVLKPPGNGVYVIAHRGAHRGIPENSLPAYRKAIDLGCDFIEIDVRTTRDGRIVSMHNSSVDEYVKGSSGKVREMTFDEIRALDIGSMSGPEWKGTEVPSFEEILQLCRGRIGIYLDLKDASVPELINIIKQYKMERDIVWYISSSRIREISELTEDCPECILMPDPGKDENICPVINRFNASVIATDMGELSEDFVRTAHMAHALVITDEDKGTEAEWSEIIGWHTDGIQTDDPEKLISFLKSRKKP